MHTYPMKKLTPILIAILSISTWGGCKNLELASHWRENEISVDGNNDEWENAVNYIEDENLMVGLLNDEDFLYVLLATNDRFMWNRMTAAGFTIWFDPDGGKKRVFGIQYPLGLQEMGEPMMGPGEFDQNREKRREVIEQSLKEIKFVGPDKDDWDRMLLSDAPGVDTKLNNEPNTFIYELKVPLRLSDDNPYAIGTEAGKSIGVGFEMHQFDRQKMMEGRGRGMPRSGMGAPGGIPGGMGGPPRGGIERPKMPDPIRFWAKVKLATQGELK